MLLKSSQRNMVVIFSKQVIDKINEYIKALTAYPISQDRMIEKVNNLRKFLLLLGESVRVPAICKYRDLGQTMNASGQPLNRSLRQVTYKDESGFQWTFACHYNYENDTITIVKMMASNQIREEVENATRSILGFWERLKKI